ncbi:hypothetical protein SAMN05444671_3716 [Flavobacterium sp. CF108]|jgi:hypothetical protein|uniref:hypothetical protein n=1 Tax=Flavobacterium TaxID=237 RepID=UPI0006ABAE96|nr:MULTISPECIES: hypothetical protein [Flavobacterium]KOP39404.1 hypothetical protein AKO67_04725 [Flavobacterium sp. VMW]MDR6762406.1 hypothetical protein [Flavobacterium sp. 2755]OWU91682.1 hypothetical protein APR43_06250 [Flavobacterium sp. NLM]PUU70189.1 hypothetical protein DBB36_09710 [Flavobacterium sp. WLB]UUF14968.1 hypothetical protein NLJ00_02410 [Flavobacterium panici]
MAIQTVGKFKLNQQGGYVCRTEFVYLDSNGQLQSSSQTGNELLGQSYTTDPGSLGVPDGSTLWMKIWVMAGHDNQAQQAFIYQSGNSAVADYTCSGTTLSNHLALDGVSS